MRLSSQISKLAASMKGGNDAAQAQRQRKIQQQAQQAAAAASKSCQCTPVVTPRYADSVCGSSSAPVVVSGARIVEDGSIELPRLKVPSVDQFFAASDRLGPTFTTKDNGELVMYSGNTDPTTGARQFDYDVETEGLPGIYRLTLTSPNAEQTKAGRVKVDLLYKQFTGNLPLVAGDAPGREGIVSFELETTANDSIIDIWALPTVSLGSNRGQVVEPAILGAIVIDGTVISIAGGGDFLPAEWGPTVTLGSDGEDGEVVTSSTASFSSFTAGDRSPYSFGSYGGVFPNYTLSICAYGPVSGQYHNMSRKLLAQVGG